MRILISLTIIMMGAFAFSSGGGSSIGPANPATINCIKLGGILEPVITPAGEDANCVLDQWQLFREMFKRGLVKEHQYPSPPAQIPNPAAVNCIDSGGTLRYEVTPEGQRGLCVIEQWVLFRIINVTN